MTSLAGTGTLTRLALRRDRITMAAWIYALAVVAYASVAATKRLYTTNEALAAFAATAGKDKVTLALYGPASDLNTLGGVNPCTASSTTACLIDDLLAQGNKSGYNFVWTGDGATPSVAFVLTGTPQVVGSSGQRMFCSDQSGVIHYDPTGSGCTNASLVLE